MNPYLKRRFGFLKLPCIIVYTKDIKKVGISSDLNKEKLEQWKSTNYTKTFLFFLVNKDGNVDLR